MATTASKKKQKKQKGKTLALTDFLADDKGGSGPGTSYVLASKPLDWASEMENMDNTDDVPEIEYGTRSHFDRSVLPTAPKAARGPDVDMEKIPNSPPYTAFIGNLAYEASEDRIHEFFKNQKVANVRLPTDQGRLRGFGYVEFEDRESLIDALTLNDSVFAGRKIRVDLAGQNQQGNERGGMGGSGSDYRRSADEPDRTDSNWRRREPGSAPERPAFDRGGDRDGGRGFSGRDGGRFGDRYGDRDGGRSFDRDGGRSFGDRDGGRSFGGDRDGGRSFGGDRDGGRSFGGDRDGGRSFGGDRDGGRSFGGDRDGGRSFGGDRDGGRSFGGDRDGGGGGRFGDRDGGGRFSDRYGDRDGDRYGGRSRGFSDRDGGRRGFGSGFQSREDGGGGGGGFSDRYGSRGGDRPSSRDTSQEAPKERPRLQLQPRSKPSDGTGAEERKSSIFGSAKPVDTSAREREIEDRLQRERQMISHRYDDEKENRNYDNRPTGSRTRRDSDRSDGGSKRERRLSSSSGKGVRPGPPPVTSQRSRRDSELSNHSDVFNDDKEEPKPATSPKKEDSSKLVDAPPPKENAWSRRPPSSQSSEPRSPTSSDPGTSPTSNQWGKGRPEQRQDNASRDSAWGKRQDRDSDNRGPGYSDRGRGRGRGMGRGGERGRGSDKKGVREKHIPKSIEEMPKFESTKKKDWSDTNKYSFLMDEEDKDSQ
ncbi:eukaryotic translation initiation factor 4B-like isoform X1 [Haliotis rufescens]|uniref:eukaryotic translation initiation factor 4B-like isoform X1 n=1 Tax=Haliotis rufescens TaxID=6454 RepID=UPI001EAFAB9A|nr:eukaryotic translation initiation factor 4B-like isoform X1 [Haliotis rufescens]